MIHIYVLSIWNILRIPKMNYLCWRGMLFMKKILYFMYGIVLTYILLLNFMDYSSDILNNLEDNKVEIVINKPKEKDNAEFISDLNDITQKMNMDIMYLITDVSNSTIKKNYYISTNTNNFIGINNAREILESYRGISNINEKSFFYINYSTLFYHIYIYNLKDAEKYNLDSCNYYIPLRKENEFIEVMSKAGYDIAKTNGTTIKNRYVTIRTIILPVLILFTTMIFYSLSKRKESMIKLLGGYSKRIIIKEYTFETFRIMIAMFLAFITTSTIIVSIMYHVNMLDYVTYCFKTLYSIILALFVGYFLVNFAVLKTTKAYHIKGKNESYDLFVVAYFLKIVFTILAIITVSNILVEIHNINAINRTNVFISKQMQHYITLPVNSASTSINESNQLIFNAHLDDFYNETVEKYHGILINTRNYRIGNLSEDDSLANTYGQNRITINENYLKLNIIHDSNGTPITGNAINPNKFNLLIPENEIENVQDIIESYSYSYDIALKDISYILYKENEPIHTFNPYSGRNNNGVIYNPIIEIYNNIYLKNQMLNYVSGQYYLLKIDNDEPYTELLPLLRKNQLDGVILYTTYISNVFDNSIKNIRERLKYDIINALLYAVSIILLITYNCIIYFQIFGDKIVYKRLCGISFVEIHKIPIILLIIQYMLFVVVNIPFYIDKGVVFVMFLLELLVFLHRTHESQKKYILKTIKGGEK